MATQHGVRRIYARSSNMNGQVVHCSHCYCCANVVSQITEPRLSYFLRGNHELSVNANVKVFNHVHTFMQETTRFN